ncbi:MAG TPA: serine protease [Acidimicrobiales bacterium]|nr:serine protease [Acidimicrobiales bacterium]
MATEQRDPPVPPAAGGLAPLRDRLPTTALGLAWMLFFMAIAAAFTGAILYAYYEYRLGKTDDKVEAFEAEFEESLDGAVQRIDEARDRALAQVDSQLDDLERFAASGETLSGLLEAAQASVWFVQTLDEAGQPSVGSAFVVFSDDEQSFLVTSYTTIRAATANPGPDITVRKGDEQLQAALTSWDPANDLALLTLDKPSLPALEWAPTDPPVQVGDRVFVISGLGAAGGSISQGFVAGVSAEGVQHDAPVGAAFQGGPLLSSNGEVVGVASRAYAPLGFSPEAVFFGVPIRNSCAQVIRCPDGSSQPG